MLRLFIQQDISQNHTDTIVIDSTVVLPPPVQLIDTISSVINPSPDTVPPAPEKDSGVSIKKSIQKPSADETVKVPANKTENPAPGLPADSLTVDSTASSYTDTTASIPPAGAIKTDTLEQSVPAHGFEPDIRPAQNNTWLVGLFLAIFILLAWLRVGYTKRIRQYFDAMLSNRYIQQLIREEFAFSNPAFIFLTLVYLISGSMLLAQANIFFTWDLFSTDDSTASGFILFLKFFGLVTLFYLGKILAVRFSALLFAAREEATEYLFNLLLFNNVLGLVLLPLSVLVLFAYSLPAKYILVASGIIVSLAFAFRLLKSIYLGSSSVKLSNAYYIILYICTLEILPLLVVIKAFNG